MKKYSSYTRWTINPAANELFPASVLETRVQAVTITNAAGEKEVHYQVIPCLPTSVPIRRKPKKT